MGCGTSSHPPKKDTRAQSRVTVAAQQRAEAAYRRQRMAQERAELTGNWRAEMEVERARMLKEMSGGGSRRPSYCKELEDLREEAPDEVRKQLDDCLQDYSVKTRNARNSLPINGYPRSTVITERRGSRDERQIMERRRSRDDRARESDENGNAKRKLSTGEKIDLDFLRIIANRSGQTSPSNVCFEENEQEADETERIDQTLELNDGIVKNKPFEDNEESRSDESNKNEDVSITDNADTSHDISHAGLVNGYNAPTSTENDDVSTTHEHPMIVDDNVEKTDHGVEPSKNSSDIKTENNSEELERSEQVHEANSDNCDSNTNVVELAGDWNVEQSGSLDRQETGGEETEEQVQQQIEQRQEQQAYVKEQNGLSEGKEKEEQTEEDGNHREEQKADIKQERDNEKQRQSDEQQEQQQQQRDEQQTQQEREKEQEGKETTENVGSGSEQETLEKWHEYLNAQSNNTQDKMSVVENSGQNDEGLISTDNVRTDNKQLEEDLEINQ